MSEPFFMALIWQNSLEKGSDRFSICNRKELIFDFKSSLHEKNILPYFSGVYAFGSNLDGSKKSSNYWFRWFQCRRF